MAFKLAVATASKKWRRETHDRNGQLHIDKKTKQPKARFYPIGHRITFNEGTMLSVNQTMLLKKYRDDKGEEKKEKVKATTYSVYDQGEPITDFFGNSTGQFGEPRKQFNGEWDKFEATYKHSGMPELVSVGIEIAEAEAAAKRAA